jgi:hypothetical protein
MRSSPDILFTPPTGATHQQGKVTPAYCRHARDLRRRTYPAVSRRGCSARLPRRLDGNYGPEFGEEQGRNGRERKCEEGECSIPNTQ